MRRYGGHDYLEKPINEARLLAAVEEGAAWTRTRRDVADRLGLLPKTI